MKPTDVRVKDVTVVYEDFRYRTPIKFGGVALDRVTILNVEMTVETRSGKVVRGFGSMPLGNVWAWPSQRLTYDQTFPNGIEPKPPADEPFRVWTLHSTLTRVTRSTAVPPNLIGVR